MSLTHDYNPLSGSEDTKDEIDNNSRPPVSIAWPKYILYMLLMACAGFGAAFGVVFALSLLKPGTSDTTGSPTATTTSLSADIALPTTSAEHSVVQADDASPLAGKVLDCGYSPTEARAKGCVYDVMMQDWVPEPCYDSILTERYLARGNYTWYADMNGNVMSDEEMRKGEHSAAWMSGDYHKDHCIFSWEKLIRAMRNNWPISQELVSYDHVLHCQHQTLGEDGHTHKRDGGIGVMAPTNYAKCALYSTWKTDFIPDKHAADTK